MAQLWVQVRRLAPHCRTVLLTGEPDSGQAAVARLLLDLSTTPRRPFVQCGAQEAEDRLVRGSGYLALPPDSFVFIPDLAQYSPLAQDALLRLLRHRRARPLTLVAAVTDDLRTLVSVGRFNAELAALLDGVRIALPPLRERVEDLPMLVSHLLCSPSDKGPRAAHTASEDLLHAIMDHRWPGNLRELEETLTAVVASAEQSLLSASDLHRALRRQETPSGQDTGALRMVSLDTVMQEHIAAVLRACRGNKLRASEVLGISRSTLYRMLDHAAMNQGEARLAG